MINILSTFLIQNMCPVTSSYIKNEYIDDIKKDIFQINKFISSIKNCEYISNNEINDVENMLSSINLKLNSIENK